MTLFPRRLRVSFQAKVLGPVLGFLVLLPLVTLWIVNRHISHQAIAEARGSLATAEAVFRNTLELRERHLLSRFRNVVADPRLKAIAQLGDAPTLTDYLRNTLDELGEETQVVVFLDPEGLVLAGAQRDARLPLHGFAVVADEVGSRALEGEASTGVVTLARRTLGAVAVPVLVREDGPLLGALLLGVQLGDAEARELKSTTRCEILLVADGAVTATTLPAARALDAALRDLLRGDDASAAAVAAEARAVPVIVDDQHALALAGDYQREPGRPARGFRYVLLSSYEDRLAALRRTQLTLVTVSLAGIAVSALIVWWLIRRITQPLRALRAGAEAVGGGDLSVRVARFSDDECGELAVAFNAMTENLHVSRTQLERTVETLKSTQAQLVQSEKLSAIGQFVAGVAHELNNPLTAIIGFSDLLQVTLKEGKPAEFAKHVARAGGRCQKIVQNLLSFSRQQPPERAPLNLNTVLDDVVDFLAYEMRASKVRVTKVYALDLPAVLGDAHQLQQVLLNLVNNARQALESHRGGGEITVTTTSTAAGVRVSVRDDGPGIARENQRKIFDPFFTTKPVGKGTGLGLSIVYGIVQEHGATIRLESEPGHGAEFILEFPLAASGAAATAAGAQTTAVKVEEHGGQRALAGTAARPRGEGQSVLVIDDESWIRQVVAEVLGRDGLDVVTAPGAEAALTLLRERRFDVIVVDAKMPGMSGPEFFEHLRMHDVAATRCLLFMSGDLLDDDFRTFLLRVGCTCLPKPFSPRDFHAAVTRRAALV